MKITPELVTRIQQHINNKQLKPDDLLVEGTTDKERAKQLLQEDF